MGLIDIPWLTDSLKKRALRYLLQRYLGHFLSEKLTLEQLSLDLYDGRGCIKDLSLDVVGLNEELVFLPFRFLDGCFIKQINCSVPWSALTKESSSFEISGACFYCCLNPSSNNNDSKDIFESSYLSKSMMTSSMQMAEEIASAEDDDSEHMDDHMPSTHQFEGIEVMAQLIDSVLRRVKVVATDTRLVMRTPASCGPNLPSSPTPSSSSSKPISEVEFKIKYMRCEEVMLDSQEGVFKCNEPGHIDKLLTLEGLEVFINGRPVSKVGGKHTVKIRASPQSSDLQVILSSPVLTILTSDELSSFFDVFCPSSPSSSLHDPTDPYHRTGKKMSDVDYARIERQLQMDVMTRSMHVSQTQIKGGNKGNILSGDSWGGDHPSSYPDSGSPMTDAKFHQFDEVMLDRNEQYTDSRHRTHTTRLRSGSSSTQKPRTTSHSSSSDSCTSFECLLKLPGIYVCLLPSQIDTSTLPLPVVPLCPVDFDSINAFLDEQVGNQNHLRLIAFPIQLNVNRSSSVSVIIGDGVILEQASDAASKVPILWSESTDKYLSAPKYRMEIIPSRKESKPTRISFIGTETTCVTFDPTILERLDDYFCDTKTLSSGTTISSPSSPPPPSPLSIELEIRSHILKVNLLFPIPDLRKEGPDVPTFSTLRSDAIMFIVEEVSVWSDFKTTRFSFDTFKAILNESGKEPVQFLDARRTIDPIEIAIATGPGSLSVEEDLSSDIFAGGDMEDSIYCQFSSSSSSSKTKIEDAFQVKKKLIKGNDSVSEHVIGPSDRKNAQDFMKACRSCTSLQIDFIIPQGEIYVDAEQLELIYNRFGNDLVMWNPKKKKASMTALSNVDQGKSVYKPCFSALADSIDSDSSFHSTEEAPINVMLNTAVVSVHVHEMSLTSLAVKDRRQDQKIKGQNVLMNLVIGMNEGKSTVMFLNGEGLKFSQTKEDESGSSVIVSHNYFVDPPPSITSSSACLDVTLDVTRYSPDFKRIKLAIGIMQGALFNTDLDVFKNFWNFINVTDEDVLGYIPPTIQTELHINVVNGAIVLESSDARPALVTFDDIYVTSAVVVKTNVTLLRLILEEAAIHLCKNKKRSSRNFAGIRDYVCVLDSGLTDLNVTLHDDGRSEVKVSNNVINIRACSDSLNGLCQLILRLASNPTNPVHSCGSVESLDDSVSMHSFEGDTGPERQTSLHVFEGDLLRDAIDECSIEEDEDESEGKSLTSTRSCDCDSKIEESGFFILGDDDVGAGITRSVEPQIRVFHNPISLKENHFTSTRSRPLPDVVKETLQRFLLEELTLIFNFYGGKDFNEEDTSLDTNYAGSSVEIGKDAFDSGRVSFKTNTSREKKEGELRVRFSDDCEPQVNMWESLNLASGGFASSPPTGYRGDKQSGYMQHASYTKSLGGRGRQNDVCVQVYLSKIKSLFETFDPSFNVSWRFILMVQEIEVRDKVTRSLINKMLYEYFSESMPRRNCANMLNIRAVSRKNPDDNNDECDLKVSVKPLRVNIDQDTLMFLIDYFSSINPPKPSSHPSSASNSSHDLSKTCESEKENEDPVSNTIDESSGCRQQQQQCLPIHSNQQTQAVVSSPVTGRRDSTTSSASKPPAIYVKSFVFSPDVPIRLDYQGKRLDFEKVCFARTVYPLCTHERITCLPLFTIIYLTLLFFFAF